MVTNTYQSNNEFDVDAEPRGKRNWPLIAGLILILTISILGIIGPNIAPQDPTEEHNIVNIEGNWYIPPFDIGTPGYPLGSDRFGRDVYSRLLWGIRPTMIMVLTVAVVRLVLGVIIGLSAGWFSGKTGRLMNSLIQVALALPVLLVALGAIAIVGVELGIWAFIIGLSLTGWVDTALQVREQTRIVKNQVYIEAASAMGATNQQILSGHVLKQIIPMLLMLFAFEVSSTLMLTAGLGFLGYYIGGDVWVDTDDFVARRISGSPELGQMLATSWLTLTKPWALVAVGTTVFLTVLGFNLIGEGLRQNMGFAKVPRKNSLTEARSRFGLWIDHYIWHPLVQFFRIRPLRMGLLTIGIFFIISLGSLYLLDAARQSSATGFSDLLNQNSSSLSDETTSQAAIEDQEVIAEPTGVIQTIRYDPEITWEFVDEGGFTGGPALSQDGTIIYVASGSGTLYAMNPDGQIIWRAGLVSGGVGSPVLNSAGEIYIADDQGGLSKISPEGEIIWHFQSEAGTKSHSGPALASDGNIFYTVGTASTAYVQAVSPEGSPLWVSEVKTRLFFATPDPSPDGKYVFLKDDIFSQPDGTYLELEFELDVNRYFSGENGDNYLLAGHKIVNWEASDDAIQVVDIYEWDSSRFADIITAVDVGVEQDETSWQLFTSPGGGTTTVWVSVDDQALGTAGARISSGNVVIMNEDLSALICGGGSFQPISTDCALISPESEEPLWHVHLGDYGPVAGGIALNGNYYVSTEEGFVFEINQNLEQVTSASQVDAESTTSYESIGYQWSYQTADHILFVSHNELDGYFFLTTEDDKLHILTPDGEMFNVIQLPAPIYHQFSDTGRSPPLTIQPIIIHDGIIILISNDDNVYAMNYGGEILWESKLESSPANYPVLDESGNLYIVDDNAGVTAFDNQGMNWHFQSEAAENTANGTAVDEAGNFYYVVTNYGKGYIQAVSNAGNPLWSIEANTRDFYDDLTISKDGKFLSLADNLVSIETGELITDDVIKDVDAFIFAENGQYYMRSLHTIKAWEPGPEGISILSSGIVSEEDTALRPPLGSSADANGIVWLYYPERYVGGGIIVVWMSPDGILLGNHLFDRDFQTMVDSDMESSLLTECIWFEETNSIDCTWLSPTSEESLSTVTLDGIPSFERGFIDGETLFIFGDANEFSYVHLGNPINQ